MIARKTLLFAGSGVSLLVALATVAVLVGPAKANKTPVTPQQLEAYDQVFMDEVRKGDLLFHGDDATAEADGGQTHHLSDGLRDVPSLRLRHPSASVPQIPGEHEPVRNAARHDQLVHRESPTKARRSILIRKR